VPLDRKLGLQLFDLLGKIIDPALKPAVLMHAAHLPKPGDRHPDQHLLDGLDRAKGRRRRQATHTRPVSSIASERS
jgi:hypothetical protein